MTVDLLASKKKKTLERDFWVFVYAQKVINAILRLTLRHELTESLELKFVCENIAFVLNDKYKHNFAQLLIDHNYIFAETS